MVSVRYQLAIMTLSFLASSTVSPALSEDYLESKNRIGEQLRSAPATKTNHNAVRRAMELQRYVLETEKIFSKGGMSQREIDVLASLYEQLERQIYFTLGESHERDSSVSPVGFEKRISSNAIAEPVEPGTTLVRSGPLDNKFYLLRFKIDTGVYSKQLSDSDARFFNDEIVRLKKLEDALSDENGMMESVAKDSMSKVIDLLDLDLRLRVTKGSLAKVVAARQLKTTCRPAPPAPPYTWYRSRFGGYYEATGQINGRFSDDAIARYGGRKNEDGNVIPISAEQSDSKSNGNL